ncbi:cupin domain-containing protein [Paraglaciecola aquimarina]|uniref:Cupin domain-containing protein n=1 Tax=Paraglaciecola aquimarina TaxID=1235557 RepID=A0ABU3SXI2_9ALTE|nr:cupin domain-containing protein [Paraglaciecola aquimarina]MDU0354716.1 cupin domain-containing protein [Paraglaciecola aquimarina]
MYHLTHFNIEQFLSDYWQKKPLLIRQGLQDFEDPIDEHELAGLTEEESVDSRIVHYQNGAWTVEHGPYADINSHCVGQWSLLVQSVDRFSPEADQLMTAFNFIPYWRMDDLMVSYSNAGAGVGPHLDQYDVFIIQGKGSRRWQVGLPSDYETIRPHCDLSQITGFEPIIDEVLSAGDILYIPANHPHNGVALEACLNYSVGFRAPSQQEMLSSFVDHAIDNNLLTKRYRDQALAPRQYSGEIKQQEIADFKELLSEALASEQFEQWLPTFLSANKKEEDPHQAIEEFSEQGIVDLLCDGHYFYRAPGVKPIFVEAKTINDHSQHLFTFYIDGETYSGPTDTAALVKRFLSKPWINQQFLTDTSEQFQSSQHSEFVRLLTRLVNKGHWYIAE